MAKNNSGSGVGGKKNPNSPFNEVVMNPTRYTGGKNAPVQVNMNPTRYTGGLNKAACDVPNGKLKK
jgi:hypothetical protein